MPAGEVALSRRRSAAPRSRFRATTAAIRRSAPSGGTSPAGCATRAGASSAFRSRSSARARASRRRARAGSRRRSSCSRTRRSPTRAGRLLHDQRAARAGFGLARSVARQRPRRDRRLVAANCPATRYTAHIVAREFALHLRSRRAAPVLLQGERGVSRKGPRDAQASYYYSRPQLARRRHGDDRQTKRATVDGVAWLDHEWSSEYLASEARGWDWTGINFDDGGALMAFAIRGKDGSALLGGRQRCGTPAAACAIAATRRRALRAAATMALAAHERRVSGGDAARGGRRDIRPRPADGRPGARLARERRHDLLGRRGARARGRRARSGAAISSSPDTAAR